MQPPEPDLPPILGSWFRIYIAILVYLVAVIAALAVFTASSHL